MRGQPAKSLRAGEVRRLLGWAGRSRWPDRNRALVLLSVRAGLRACEIAALEWSMILTARRQVGRCLELPGWAAKKGSGRRIPLHPQLQAALRRLASVSELRGPVIVSERGGPMTAKTVVNWFGRVYCDLELEGCSSHSGRRTFITSAARLAHKAGASLRDVQLLAGHRSLTTTQSYIDGDADSQRRLVRML